MELEMCKQRNISEISGTRLPWIKDATCFGGGPGRPPQEGDEDERMEIDTFCNVYGVIHEDDEHIGAAIVDLLGPHCFAGQLVWPSLQCFSLTYMLIRLTSAADVLLSHALVNGNNALAEILLNVGVELNLEHYKIGLRVSESRASCYS